MKRLSSLRLGRAIQEIRQGLGITQHFLGLEAGLSRQIIAHMEQGKRRVFLDQVVAVAAALQVPVTALLALATVDDEPLVLGAGCLLMIAPHHVIPLSFGVVTRVTREGNYYVLREGEPRSKFYSPECVKRIP